MVRPRTALAIALFGIVTSPLVALELGSSAGVGTSALFAAVGIALFPERSTG